MFARHRPWPRHTLAGCMRDVWSRINRLSSVIFIVIVIAVFVLINWLLQELACKKCSEEIIDSLCIVFDLQDFSTTNMDYQFVKNLIWLLSHHYPERLGVCLIINAPTVFYGCWAVIKPWSVLLCLSCIWINLSIKCWWCLEDNLAESIGSLPLGL